MAGWGFSLESLKSKVQEAGEKVALCAMLRAPDACAKRCRAAGLVSAEPGRLTRARCGRSRPG